MRIVGESVALTLNVAFVEPKKQVSCHCNVGVAEASCHVNRDPVIGLRW
jgi:hypothetical protein